MSARRDVWVAAALLAGLFLAGVAAGVGVDRLLLLPAARSGPPGPPMGAPVERLRGELGLDDEQAEKLRAIFDDARREADAVHEKTRPTLDEIFERTHARAREVLTPEQRERFDELVRDRPRPPGPPGRPPGPPGPPGRPPPGHPPGPPPGPPPPGR